jgi:transaldolase
LPLVCRIHDCYYKDCNVKDIPSAEDPKVQFMTKIYNYFNKLDYCIKVIGASFRDPGKIIEPAGCDFFTISLKLLGELQRKGS